MLAIAVGATRDFGLWLSVCVAWALGFLVITITRTIHSLQLVGAGGGGILWDDLRLQEEVVFFLDTLNIEDLERDEYEAQEHDEHVANEVQIVHARQPVMVRDRVGPVEQTHVTVTHCNEDVEGDQQNIIEHNADRECLQEQDQRDLFVWIREEF